MGSSRIYLSSPTTHGDEMKYIQEAFDSNWVAPMGANVDAFERDIAEYAGVGYAAALVNGTSAIHLAVKLAGVKPHDKVICSDLTFSGSVNPVSYEYGEQVFVDSEYETWNMDPRALELAFRRYPDCRAVIAVNLYGVPAKLDEIREICDVNGAVLIEDAAESLGATYKGRQTGSFGKYGVISFNGNKIITTSGGGILLSDDAGAVRKARFWATQSREPALWYQHEEIGYNYRMSNIVAGIGRGQLPYIGEHIARKKAIYEFYSSALADLPLTMNPHHGCSEPNYWLSCILLNKGCGHEPQELIKKLAENDIESRPVWKPMHLQPVFAGNDFVSVSRGADADIFSRGLCLPSDIKMTGQDLDRVCTLIREFWE